MVLGERFRHALHEALRRHATQTRKGTEIPYAAHLLSTAALVLQFGGDEDQAIAALLHDAAEDAGGRTTVDELRRMFGGPVADMVEGCTDTLDDPKPPWRPRKEAYIAHLQGEKAAALLVSACDKLDNARAIVADLRREGPGTLDRFSGGRDTVWYYRAITSALSAAGRGTRVEDVVRELEPVVSEMERLCSAPLAAPPR
jgi:(p)ppGpp synthase/HD superfamily hydrolase